MACSSQRERSPRRRPRTSRLLTSLLLTTVLVGAGLPVPAASAASVPSGFRVAEYGFSLAAATALAPLPDGRLLVAQQAGQLRMVRNDRLLATPVLTVAVDPERERGLLGVTAHPAFATNGFLYVHYVVPAAGASAPHARVERWTLPAGSNVATPSSRRVLLDLPGLDATNHNGGALHFDRWGKLMVAVGENAVPERSQSLTSPFGKILRIEPATGYAAVGNPFAGSSSNPWTRRIWALGLRNPYTFAVSRESGRVHVNDVGQDSFEEVNLGEPGANYGWPHYEGPEGPEGFIRPIESYPHGPGRPECSIAGGAFYEPTRTTFPAAYVGDYFYGDFCAGWVRRYDVALDQSAPFASGMNGLVDITVAVGGRLYVLTRTQLFRVEHPGP